MRNRKSGIPHPFLFFVFLLFPLEKLIPGTRYIFLEGKTKGFTTVRGGEYHIIIPPWANVSMFDISTVVGIVASVPNKSALETTRRELSEDVPFGIGTICTLWVVEHSSFEKSPRGVRHEPSYTALHYSTFRLFFVSCCRKTKHRSFAKKCAHHS